MSMDDLLAREATAHHLVLTFLRSADVPIRETIAAFDAYRVLCQAVVFADLTGAQEKEAQLWDTHVAGRKLFSARLKALRKPASGDKLVVQERDHVHLYKKFLRASVSFYRDHIYKLSVAFEIPELKAVAQSVEPKHPADLSHRVLKIDDSFRKLVIVSCHSALIYLGDLMRYRASEKLDPKPDFGPALGYYDLASTIYPRSGMGHHQQAVVALEKREHLRAIYHLYRADCVLEPHPNAANNLGLQFVKVDSAWKAGTLIKQGKPNDPDHPKDVLVGWFVHLRSLCHKGEAPEGYTELESTVISQLDNLLRRRSIETALHRMVIVNIAAQHTTIRNYQAKQSTENEQAFYSALRINLRFYTTLLGIFQDDLITRAHDPDSAESELQDSILPASQRVLPALRLYSDWLLESSRLLFGLADDPKFTELIKGFWKTYGRTLDLVASVFPIWDLEEVAHIEYQLEEDVDILGFEPLSAFTDEKTGKFWEKKQSATLRARFSDESITRVTGNGEDLVRVYGFLEDGLYIANDVEDSPIKIKGSRVFYGNGDGLEQLLLPAVFEKPAPNKAAEVRRPAPVPKPLSYAAVAATVQTRRAAPTNNTNGVPKLYQTASVAREQSMTRMVDDLVDDEESKDPVTPPPHFASEPAVFNANVDFALPSLRDSTPDIGTVNSAYSVKSPVQRRPTSLTSPWTTSAMASPSPTVSRLPPSAPFGMLSSPGPGHKHSRVGSSNSIRSHASQTVGDSWSSLESLPQQTGMGRVSNQAPIAGLAGYGQSALLFGASPNVWSTGAANRTFGATSPGRGAG